MERLTDEILRSFSKTIAGLKRHGRSEIEVDIDEMESLLAELRERRAADIECSHIDCGHKATAVDWLGRDVCDEHK